MSWIKEVDEQDASGELARLYEELLAKRGKVANILKVHSLNPASLRNHLDLYMTLMFGESGLSRAERESIAVVTSANNDCDYCVSHHDEALRLYEKDPQVRERMREGKTFDALPARTAAILAHARKLTNKPGEICAADIVKLRHAGLEDRDILDITLVTAYFNFVNRIALGLGVTFDENELTGYKS